MKQKERPGKSLHSVECMQYQYKNVIILFAFHSADYEEICIYCSKDMPSSTQSEYFPQCEDSAEKPKILTELFWQELQNLKMQYEHSPSLLVPFISQPHCYSFV